MTQPVFLIETGDGIPQDIPPSADDDTPPPATLPSGSGERPASEWYNADFPHSTPDAPYGYFDLPDNSGPDFDRPRKKRPRGYTGDARPAPGNKTASTGGNGKVTRRTAASDAQARQAAHLLATLNNILAVSVGMLGMPLTGEQIKLANEEFEEAAYNALLNDPALCRKILAAGASGGKAQLTMAYLLFAGMVAPVAWAEIQQAKEVE